MAVRATEENVTSIIDTDRVALQISAFIATANVIVNDNLVGAGLSDATLTQIEIWLAAHLIAISDQREVRVNVLQSEVEYHVPKFGMGLKATAYGQQALALDWSGRLAALGNMRAFIEVL
jgi:hypothetical protein